MNSPVDTFSFDGCIMRRVRNDDIEKIVDIINEAFSYQDEIVGEPRTGIDHLSRRISETDFYVVENSDEIVACFYLEPHDGSLHFGLLAVIPSYRGKGLAKETVGAIEQFAKKAKYTSLELDYTSISPWLKKYYECYGFCETGDEGVWGPIKLIRMRKNIEK